MTGPHDRRGFLRGLATLPLIGGGVTLLGQPTAAAELVTDALLAEYVNWLGHERHRAADEWTRGDRSADFYQWHGPASDWHRADAIAQVKPSTRAAIVLAAVGCDWRRP